MSSSERETEDRYGRDVPGLLGRRFTEHNPANLRYLSRPLLDAAGVTDGNVFWPLPPTGGPFPLDQGQEGACTGYGEAHELAVGPVQFPAVTDATAQERYRRNREEDRRLGYIFADGATVQGTMAAALADKVITGYVWNKGLSDTVRALQVGPVALGIDWSQGQYTAGPDGLVTVSGQWVGGHYILLVARQVEDLPGLPPVVRKYGPGSWWLNSWGTQYGIALPPVGARIGCGFVPDETLAAILARQGESVSQRDYFVAPDPTPTPEPDVPPAPTPVPPVPGPDDPVDPPPAPKPPKPHKPRRPRPGDRWDVWLEWWRWERRHTEGHN